MVESFNWLKKRLEGPAEHSVEKEISARGRKQAEERTRMIAKHERRIPPERLQQLKESFRDVDFKEVQNIVDDYVRKSSGEEVHKPVVQLSDIYIIPGLPFRAGADGVAGTIAVDFDAVEQTSVVSEDVTMDEHKRLQMFSDMEFLYTIFHEQAHHMAKVIESGLLSVNGYERKGPFGKTVFSVFNEGMTELIAHDLMRTYIQRRGFRGYSFSNLQDYFETNQPSYVQSSYVVLLISVLISRHTTDVPLPAVWHSLIRGYVRGLKLDHTEVDLQAVIGKENFKLLKYSSPEDYDAIEQLHDSLSALVGDEIEQS